MRKSAMEKLLELKRKKVETSQMTLDDLFLLLLDGGRSVGEREANPTQRSFVYDPYPFKGFMGPKGSAKTSAICSAGWLRSIMQPGSKGLVARKDYNDLKQTTKLRMEEMLRRLPKDLLLDRTKDPPETWYINAVPALSPEGDVIDDTPSQMTFMGLESAEEMGSYEFDWAAIDEAGEVSERSVHSVNGLMRNMPKWWKPNETRYSTMLSFNPTDTFHWLYTACTGKDSNGRTVRDPWIKLFTPVPKENQRNLPTKYYENLRKTMPEDMALRLVEGQWGATFEGQPVYREFKFALHAKRNLPYDPHAALFRFWDFGYRHPWCGWFQFDFRGRLLGLMEQNGENIEIDAFVSKCKAIEQIKFPSHREIYDYGDPAARQKKDTGSTLTALSKVGIMLRWKISTIDVGIRVGRDWLERIIDGEPALQFDIDGMPVLIAALRGGYHLDDIGQKPVKDGYYDHSADGWRYGMVNLFGGGLSQEQIKNLPSSLEYNPAGDKYRK